MSGRKEGRDGQGEEGGADQAGRTGARLSEADTRRIAALRAADPERWTFWALAAKFGTTDSNCYRIVNRPARRKK